MSDQSRHTGAPWRAGHDGSIEARCFTGEWKNVCDRVRGGSPQETAANRHLIAAAPELLATCGEFVAMYADVMDIVGETVRQKLARAAAAIAKAEGASTG